jgi:hypothetical protein
MEWKDGRLTVDGAAALDVETCGARADAAAFADGALVLRSKSGPTTDDDTIELRVRRSASNGSRGAQASRVFVPHLTPAPGNVIGDWVFRSPAIVVADESIALAFVVDVEDVARAKGFRAWLDYDHAASTVTLAAGNYRHDGHVFFVRELARMEADTRVELRLHVLASTRAEDLSNPYGMVARFCWERWGRPRFQRFDRASLPIASHLDRIVRWAFTSEGWGDSVWQNLKLQVQGAGFAEVGAPVFIVDVGRHPSIPLEKRTWRERRSIWNQAWFSTQRCANGLLRYARQVGSADLEQCARAMTEVALAAPQRDGLFPAVLAHVDGDRWRWSNSDRRPSSASEDGCHLVDAAFTCRKLLEWHALTSEPRAMLYVQRFATRVLELQRSSGAFPGWVEPDGRVPEELAEGPESAVATALLFDLHRIADGDTIYRDAALQGAAFLEGVAREGRWEDFETYYSCAPWGRDSQMGTRVARNGVFKQNTLSIAWCAEAFLKAWDATNDAAWLARARRCIDELSLYQAVWDPRFLPAPAHGGFGVMNADSEWNDARQSLFARLYFQMWRATGERELLERGVSALRASFSMLYCPENAALARAYEARFPFFGPETYGFMMENQGHDPAQPIGTFTIFTWGNGSALEAVATARDLFPDIAKEHGFG